MKQAFSYSLKIWLTTIVVSPLLIGLLLNEITIKLVTENVFDFLGGELFIMVFGSVICIPSYILQALLLFYLNQRKLKIWHKKLYLSIFALFLSILSFSILNCQLLFDARNSISDYLPGNIIFWVISVWIIIIICIWSYKLKAQMSKEIELNQPLTQ